MEDNLDFKKVTVQGLSDEQYRIHRANTQTGSTAPLKDVYTPEQVSSIPSSIHGLKLSLFDKGDLLLQGITGKEANITKDVIDPKYLDAIYKVDNNKLVFSLDQQNYFPVRPIDVEFSDFQRNQNNLVNQGHFRISEIAHYHNNPVVVEEKMQHLKVVFENLDKSHKQEFINNIDRVIEKEIPTILDITPTKLENVLSDIKPILLAKEKDFEIDLKLTDEQKNAFANFYEYNIPDPKASLTKEQLNLIPDVIDGIKLDNTQKQLLATEFLDITKDGRSYYLADNKILREQITFDGYETDMVRQTVKESEISFNKPIAIELNTANQKYLENQIKYLGFGDELKTVLKDQLISGNDKFKIEFPVEKENHSAQYSLNFSKGTKTDMYFFNSFDIKLQDSKGKELEHNFQVNGTQGVTAKEALNILEGRSAKAVIDFKHAGEKEVFIQLDKSFVPDKGEENKVKLKYFDTNYGIDTKSIIENSKFQLAHENYKEDAIKSLEKGNFVKAQFQYEGKPMDGLISLNAQDKSVDYYDLDQKRLNSKQIGITEIKERSTEQDNTVNQKR